MTRHTLPPRGWQLIQGVSPAALEALPRHSVHQVVTSPPYYRKRDYDPNDPEWAQLGQEAEPEEFIENLVACFDPLLDALRPDGSLVVVIGDTRAGSGGPGGDYNDGGLRAGQPRWEGTARAGTARPDPRLGHDRIEGGVTGRRGHGAGALANHKNKDLIGIPFLFAQAMKARGWYWRDDIIWAKPNPMPEGPKDRTANSHEYVWLFTPSAKTWWDFYAVQEPAVPKVIKRKGHRTIKLVAPKRWRRSVWRIPVSTYKGAHFATFPEELAALAIAGGTSEIGVCSTCGASPTRIVHRDDATKQLNHRGWQLPDCGHTWLPTGATVLDPFNGAGTTGVAAMRRGRSYIGVEPVAANVDLTVARFHAELPVIALNGSVTIDASAPTEALA